MFELVKKDSSALIQSFSDFYENLGSLRKSIDVLTGDLMEESKDDSKALKQLETTRKTAEDLIGELESVNLIKNIDLKKNEFMQEKSAIQLFLMINVLKDDSFASKIKNTKKIMSIISRGLSNNAILAKKDAELKDVISLANKSMTLLDSVQADLDNIAKNKDLNYIYSVARKNLRFKIDSPIQTSTGQVIRPNINVVIRNNRKGELSFSELKNAMYFFLKGSVEYSGTDEYLNRITAIFRETMLNILRKKSEIYTSIFGNNPSFTMYFDIEGGEGRGFVYESVKKLFKGRVATITEYDPTHKQFEINISSWYLNDCIEKNNPGMLADTIIHETTHLSDSKLPNNESINLVRVEGLAVFSEFAYNRNTGVQYTQNFVSMLSRKPITSIKQYNELYAEDDMLPYYLGEFIFFCIFANTISRKYPDKFKKLGLNAVTGEGTRGVQSDPELLREAQQIVRIFSNIKTKDLFEYYLKIQRVPKLITKKILDEL